LQELAKQPKHARHEEHLQLLNTVREQLQWNRLDQDTRTPGDREQVFYWSQGGEIQKGRIRLRDERGGEKKKKGKEDAYSFSIETTMSKMGKVHADLDLKGGRLSVRLTDEKGTAREAVESERQTLSAELKEIGIVLAELAYGKTPLHAPPQITQKTAQHAGLLDVVG
jgi:hypothetical protein